MKKINGYILLDSLKVSQRIPRDTKGEVLKFFDQQELYFKACSEAEIISYLFCERIFKALSFPVVHFEMAMYQGKMGVLATSYNPNHQKEISLQKILNIYYSEYVVKHKHKSWITKPYDLYNLEDLEKALLYYYKDDGIVLSLMSQLTFLFFSQFFTGDYDMHAKNLVVIDNQIAPLFDFGGSFKLQFDSNFYTLALDKKSRFGVRKTPRKALSEFPSEYLDLMREMLLKLPTQDEILIDIEKQIGFPIHANLTRHICFDHYKQEISLFLNQPHISFK